MRTQVAIIGGGPSGLLLSQLLNRRGISTIVLEKKSRDYVLARVRAGFLEWGTVELLREAGVGARMDREGITHDGCFFASGGRKFRVDFHAVTGRKMMVWGQTELTRDLYDAQDAIGATIFHEVADVALHGLTTERPHVTFSVDGLARQLDCDFVAGCDGFHGVSRQSIPAGRRHEFEKIYPFGWLGILANTPPLAEEAIYASHERGFALASMRKPNLSRYYIQVPLAERAADWSDEAFWSEFKARFPEHVIEHLVTGPSIEKSIAPLRSFVTEPMRWGRLFLCGDAAHIVPPTGAKGLNLAASDVYYLNDALTRFYAADDAAGLDAYSERALARVWKAMRFSWSMTTMLHRFPEHTAYERRMYETEFASLEYSPAVQRVMAENYTGLPY
ncbi:4-hydroxybenzoate 3-monooxygenase [Mesorhizobium sp. NPDC059025]|uniref:4-hydroxybenzoate 3-monooxygenase n=1 Tax=unclassified Mesorhizobium TaxID=325217 RepID=UPI003691559B